MAVRSGRDWVAHASRVLVAVFHRNNLSSCCAMEHPARLLRKVRDREDALGPSRTGICTRDACATQSLRQA